MPDVLHLGLTGGIGSGKSTVAALLVARGAGLVDADAISRQSTACGGAAIDAIRAVFGPEFIQANGALNRERMRQTVFSDPSAKQRLEQIIHPLVQEETQRQTQQARLAGVRCMVFDIPLLVESAHWRARLHQVLVIDCAEQTQIQRVMQRSKLTRAQVQLIMQQQADRRLRLQAADHVICNDGISLAALEQLLDALAPRFGL